MQSKINNQFVKEMEQIQYTDYIGLMMSSITTIINTITYALTGINNLRAFLPIPAAVILILILSSIAKSTILQYRQCIAGGGFATKSCRSYCPRKADGFAAAFSGTANNTVVCNRGQYISVALTLLSGLIPSRSAAKKDPVVALRTE